MTSHISNSINLIPRPEGGLWHLCHMSQINPSSLFPHHRPSERRNARALPRCCFYPPTTPYFKTDSYLHSLVVFPKLEARCSPRSPTLPSRCNFSSSQENTLPGRRAVQGLSLISHLSTPPVTMFRLLHHEYIHLFLLV